MRNWMLKPVHTGFDAFVQCWAVVSFTVYAEDYGIVGGLLALAAVLMFGAITTVFYRKWDEHR